MTPEQLAELLDYLGAAAENQLRLAAAVPDGLPGNMYSSGRARGLLMAKDKLLTILNGAS